MTTIKRVIDVGAAGVGMAMLAPVFVVIGIAIKLHDRGPVFFRQQRVGRHGRPFRMWKFRTMSADAEQRGPLLTVGEDTRVTTLGRWLRAYKLDELPQLINVLAGEMSLVGPRPEVQRYVERYTAEHRRVLRLVPGITDPASIRYRRESDLLAHSHDPEATYVREIMPEKIRINLEYAARATRWSDVRVVLETLQHMFEPDSAPISSAPSRQHPRARGAPAAEWLATALLRHRRPVIVATHVVLISLAYLLAYALRFDLRVPPRALRLFAITLPWLLVIRLATFARYGLYRGYWHHVGLHDLIAVAKAATLSSALFVLGLAVGGVLRAVPRSVFVIDWMVIVLGAGGVRFAWRCVREGYIPFRGSTGRRVLVIGAGESADRFVRLTRYGRERSEHIVALADDDPAKRGMMLHGIRVAGTTAAIPALVERFHVELVVIAIPSATPEQLRTIVGQCLAAKVEFKQLPPLREMLGGQVKFGQLRPVEVEHLLARAPVMLDATPVWRDIEGRVVLITGGAGSVGSELARQIARFRPARLVLLDQAESPLYFVDLELRQAYPDLDLVPIIGDIADRERMAHFFSLYHPDHVFHAAAYKHVPMMEANPVEAIRNNVLGTLRVAQCAMQFGVRKFVLISTDKAVHPSSIMGATKRVAERLVLGWPYVCNSATDFRAVRFGNVLGSEGSVVPLFKRQLAVGGPLTVTHPDIERYFMTLPEAAQLVLQSAALPEAAGRIALLDMGEPVRIVDLAENLIRLSGLEPHRDVQIVFTGLRPGEKLHEDLMSELEAAIPTSVDKVRVVQTDDMDGAALERGIKRLTAAVALGNYHRILTELRALVPECVPPLRVAQPAALSTSMAAPYARDALGA
ncbi:MAG TPA: polysaccharide biosynthesis protein [Gemmatimonadaceae bacterium]|nr:polysaccharide biosynthesis protein [Gemmatimonadaceae bacterium]